MDTVPTLLVEDEPDLREALGEYLEICGFSVTAVASAAEALAAARRNPPRIVLCDLSLPDQRGDAFLEAFHGEFPSCQLYIHSGDTSFRPSPALVRCGVSPDRVFAKPTDLGALVARLRADGTRLGAV
jgi:two-component system OmpR family response regulator